MPITIVDLVNGYWYGPTLACPIGGPATNVTEEETKIDPSFVTTASELPTGVAGKSYFFQFKFVGNPAPFFEVTGYTEPVTYNNSGVLFVPKLAEGSVTVTANLLENVNGSAGQVVDSITWDLTGTPQAQLTNAVINTTTYAPIVYGQSENVVPLDVSGSEPFTLDGSNLPPGVSVRGGSLTRSELVSLGCISGVPSQEGQFSNVIIGVTGATGVRTQISSTMVVNRSPEFVDLIAPPQFPSNTPGEWSLLPFIRAYPPITQITVSPSIDTIHANLSIGEDPPRIIYGDLTTIASSTTAPITITLQSNGIGTPESITFPLQIGQSSVPTPGIVASFDLFNQGQSNGTEVTSVADLAQGSSLTMNTNLKIAGTTGPAFDATNKCMQMRTGKSIGIPIDVGAVPFAIGIDATFYDTGPSGTREWLRADEQYAYFDEGAAGGGAPTYTESNAFTKTGTRSSDTFSVTPSQTAKAFVVKIGHGRNSADIISTLTMSNGGASVSLTRATSAADTNNKPVRTYIYFRGDSIPTGQVTFTLTYTGSISDPVYIVVESYQANADVQIVSTPTPIQANTANPSLLFDTTVSNRDCLATVMLGSGQQTLASITDGGSQTRQHTFTYDADVDGTVSYGIVSRKNRTGTADPDTISVPDPGFAPKGVFMVAWGGTTTDEISSMSYGGVNVPIVYTAADATSSFTRRLIIGFVGAGLPTGAQTATFDFTSATTVDYELLVLPIAGSGDLEIVDQDGLNGDSITNASVTLQYGGRRCQTVDFAMFNLADVTNITPNGNMSVLQEIDKGTSIWTCYKQTTPGTSDFTCSYTNASTSVFSRAFAVSEIANARDTNFIASRQTTHSTADATLSYTVASNDCAMCGITLSEVSGGAGVIMSLGHSSLGSTAGQSGVLNTRVRQILYAASQTTGSYWKNGVKSSLTLGGPNLLAKALKNIIIHGQQCNWDCHKIYIWRGVLSDVNATTLDGLLNTNVTPPTPQPPSPPTNVSATGGSAVVNLSWTNSINTTSVKIERSTTSGSGFSQIASGVTGTTYQDTGRTNGTTYYYKIRATGAGGDSAYTSEVSATPQAAATGSPANNRITSVGSTTFTQDWDAVSGATYKVYRGTSNGGPYTLIASGVTDTFYQHTGLANGTTYYVVVKATVSGVDSADSNQAQATPVAPISGAIKDTDARIMVGVVTNMARPFSWHNASLTMIGPPGVNLAQFRTVPETGLLVGNRTIIKKTDGAFGNDTSRKYLQIAICKEMPGYNAPSEDTRRWGCGGQYTTSVAYGKAYWFGYDLYVHESLWVGMGGRFDTSLDGLHHVNITGLKGTPMTLFLKPRVDETGMDARVVIRHNNGILQSINRIENTLDQTYTRSITKNVRYLFIARIKPDYTTGGSFQLWIRETSASGVTTWRNNANPVASYNGRVGYLLNDQRLQPRGFPAMYNWRSGKDDKGVSHNYNGDAWNNSPNNVILTGDTGWQQAASKGIFLSEEGSGPTIDRLSMAAFLDTVTY